MRDVHKMKPLEESIAKKKGLAVWFVSRCYTPNRREEYVRELSKYIQVDIYGACGTRPDPCKKITNKFARVECVNRLLNIYKFYLAFENSNCQSYITEKYYKLYKEETIFTVDIVPIVRGAQLSDYESIAPTQHSFIYAPAYPGPKSLAEYILYLDRNDTAYLEYFNWKRELLSRLRKIPENFLSFSNSRFYVKPKYISPMCDLCLHLHNRTYLQEKKTGFNVSKNLNFIKDCYTPDELKRNPKFTFNNLKNLCSFNSNDTDWSLK